MKKCKTCKEVLPLDSFTPSPSGAQGRLAHCRPCRRNKDSYKVTTEQRRRHHLKHQYGITPERVAEMRVEQADACAICGCVLEGWGHKTGPHIDHCHTSGKVRGLLCASCNLGLGKFKDSPEILEAAVAYLRRVS